MPRRSFIVALIVGTILNLINQGDTLFEGGRLKRCKERTIYSNADIAKLMNQWFVNVKVDSEEHPDVGKIYMIARELMTGGGGGSPNNLFLTPDLKPFYAGSYFPPRDDPAAGPGISHHPRGDRSRVENRSRSGARRC